MIFFDTSATDLRLISLYYGEKKNIFSLGADVKKSSYVWYLSAFLGFEWENYMINYEVY